MLHAVCADSSVVSDAAMSDFTAFSVRSQVKSTFAQNTTVFVVALAVGDFAVVVLFEEGVVAVLADFALLFFAAEDGVGETVVVHETVSGFTLVANDHITESEVLGAV